MVFRLLRAPVLHPSSKIVGKEESKFILIIIKKFINQWWVWQGISHSGVFFVCRYYSRINSCCVSINRFHVCVVEEGRGKKSKHYSKGQNSPNFPIFHINLNYNYLEHRFFWNIGYKVAETNRGRKSLADFTIARLNSLLGRAPHFPVSKKPEYPKVSDNCKRRTASI